ncbi:hypothetical protein K2Y11_01665 [bacterium]|nr:hypothetical protein [bacterium]
MSRSHLIGAFIFFGALSTSRAETVSLYLEDFQSSGVMGYTFNSTEVYYGSSGLFRLRTSDPVGPNALKLTDPEYGFCIDIQQDFSSILSPYDVGALTTANVPVNPISGPITPARALLIEQLWAKYYDPSWELPGPYSNTQITDAIAFHAMLFEIATDFDGVSLGSLNLSSGNFTLQSGYLLDVNDPLQELPVVPVAQSYLDGLSLSYNGPLPNLLALTNPDFQDYIVEVVPEASTVTMLLVGTTMFGAGYTWRRRRGISA